MSESGAARVPVLIVGSGPAGLSAAVLLADLGVRTLLVERNPSTTDHPRAHVVNTRSMEIFRVVGGRITEVWNCGYKQGIWQ